MLHISLTPTQMKAGRGTVITWHFRLQELTFVTKVCFKIVLPPEFVRLSGALAGKIGLLRAAKPEPYPLKLFCKQPGTYRLHVVEISCRDAIQQLIPIPDMRFDLTVVPKPAPKTAVSETRAARRKRLTAVMKAHFNIDELVALVFNMGLDDELFAQTRKPQFIREIIQFCERKNRMDELEREIQRSRSDS